MKMKLIVLAMVLAMMLLFSACSGEPAAQPSVENTEAQTGANGETQEPVEIAPDVLVETTMELDLEAK